VHINLKSNCLLIGSESLAFAMPKASLWDNLLPLNPLKGNGKRIFAPVGFKMQLQCCVVKINQVLAFNFKVTLLLALAFNHIAAIRSNLSYRSLPRGHDTFVLIQKYPILSLRKHECQSQ
jgi:hypothetical protein